MILIQKIKALLKRFSEPTFGGKELKEWQSDFRKTEGMHLESIILAIKESEELPTNQILSDQDIIQIFQQSNKISSICLSTYAISKFDFVSQEVEDKLILFLSHQDESVRRFSGISLTKIGTVSALSAVVKGNLHGHGIRTRAADKLRELGPKAEAAVPALFSLIQYQKINFRTHYVAAEALASIGTAAEKQLLANLDHEDPNLRYYSAYALLIFNEEVYDNSKINEILDKGIYKIQ